MSQSQYTELLATVIRCIPRGLSPETAQYWITDQKALSDVLLNALSATVESLSQHVINCDVDPFIPEGWKVEEHKKGGQQLVWDSTKVVLFLSDKQKNGKSIKGHDLRKELTGLPVLNANVLDYLISHPELIPESWKGQFVYFWGTIYRYADGHLYVRCLCWGDGRWCWDYDWLRNDWSGRSPAAVSASV